MLKVTVAGRLGRDAEFRTMQDGTGICNFAVAADVGFGDKKKTYWVDVAKFGKGSEGLSKILRKGASVAVTGELGTREHQGKTYLQCRADDITILGGAQGGGQRDNYDQGRKPSPQPAYDDLDDSDIPF
jgi:single-strand DNA-binding protein